ncbi:putative AraC family transcriptional regulator [Gottschalkia acidurici 9a]|uniref:AraC family transcriptional regulator n=1 Tax=Gottschalkia acidurici (strain ATCC 7906 / DSM 604 / BCRC 14475 / CIP 104303 / KCTC 5404 / NCIMB 10678 / 9a) TaxID=1128398 RepID=K0AVH3_GOTA9|nr:GyrI-like domain-containing protein [Gottschalkia acidurici]AFS77843.1 putative AraC family transcriptional regulator [Gottschalkia acidurici 9a]
MNYEVVYLKEKTVSGLKSQTSNSDPNMSKVIGELWQKYFEKGIYESIPNKKNEKSIGLYTNYESGINGTYDIMVCCEISDSSNMVDVVETYIIPDGKYAKFIVNGDVQKAVSEFWNKLWSMDLDRKCSCDFEEYQSGSDMSNTEIHIYISIN